MGKKFLLSAILASLLLEGSYALDSTNIISMPNPVENNASNSKISAPSELIVSFNDDTDMDEVSKELDNMFSNFTKKQYSLVKAMHLKVPSMAYDSIKSELENNSVLKDKIKTIEPNYAYSYVEQSNDTYYSDLWAVENTGQSVNGTSGTDDADMDVKEAWDINKGSSDVVVAVLDTGVDYTHSDLSDNMWRGNSNHGYDFAGDDDGNNDDNPMPDTPYDENGHYHGTHVAGTIGAVGDNSNGVSGVVQNVQIMAVKVFRPNGYGYSSDILEGLDYVSEQIDNGVKVVAINASYGGSGGSNGDTTDQAIQKLGDKGVVFCAAAGNDGKNIDEDPVYPASYSATNIITIAASDQDDNLASFSNYGKETVEVAAPGTNILSTYPDNQYAYLQGTSMATPNVTGTVALLASINPSSSVDEIIKAIEDNVDTKSDLTDKVSTNGRVNTNKAALSLDEGNSAPVANDDTAETDYETTVIIDVLSNDSDADSDTLTITSVSTPANGQAVISDNKIEYTPNDGYSGTDNFTYTVSDGKGGEDDATVTVTVNEPVNSAPIAQDDSATVDEDNSIIIDVLANDSDPDGDAISIKSVTQPENGKVEIVDNKIEYTPNENFNGDDSFSYTVTDDKGNESVAKVAVKVNAVNDAPTANSDSAETNEDTKVVIDVLNNDSDIDGDSLTIKSVSTPSHGKVEIVDNKIEYTPNENYNGDDSFEYTIADSDGLESTAKVDVKIQEVNDAPVASDFIEEIQEDSEVVVKLEASDVDGDSLTYKIVKEPEHGTLSTNDGINFSYIPEKDYNGEDSFSYVANDGEVDSNEAVVSIKIEAVNDAPIASDDSASTEYESEVLIDVLSNDSDVDGDSLSIKSVTEPSNGKAEIVDGKIKYTPNEGFSGDDEFSYTITDGQEDAIAKVKVSVSEKDNTLPVAKDDTASTQYETSVVIDVLSNDSDADNDSLTLKSVTEPENGEVKIVDNKVEYTPKSGFSGTDTFNYTVSDGKGGEATANVTVTVESKENTPPTANNDTAETEYETKVVIDVLANDSDADNDSLSIESVTNAANGTVKIVDNKVEYTPNSGFSGADTFNYTVSDGKGGEAQASVTVTVKEQSDDNGDNNINHLPLPQADGTFFIQKNTPQELDVLSNDSDPDGDKLSIVAVSTPEHGVAIITDNGTILYTPNNDYTGSDTFNYTVSDGRGGEAQANVTVMVTQSDDENNNIEHTFPIIGDNGVETPTKIIGDFIETVKDNIHIFELKDAEGEIEVDANTGEVKLVNIDAPTPEDKLPVGTIIEVDDGKLSATFKLDKNIKFK